MHKFVRGLITEWRRLELPFENATFVVAVSGGADSVALLIGLEELRTAKKLQNRIVAAHFNHKLRGNESETDEEFVKILCGRLKIELAVGEGHLSHSGNLEQNAREARYDFLKKTAQSLSAQAVLTAHTQNDQAETFLMNLIRGSGPDGLGGMRVVRTLSDSETPETRETPETVETRGANGTNDASGTRERNEADNADEIPSSPLLPFLETPLLLVRPLLNWARRPDTEAYCHDREIEYRYDSMNEDLDFTRVRIRKLLLPMLEEFNPKIVETLANTARLLQGEASTEKPETAASADNPTNEGEAVSDDELELKELRSLEKPELYRTLRSWLTHKRGNSRGLSLKHIEAIERLALSRKSGRMVELPGDAAIVKTGGRLVFKEIKVEKSQVGG